MSRVLVLCFGVVMVALVLGQQPDAGDQSGPLDGMSILQMGREYKDPLLRLLGTAMRNNKLDILRKLDTQQGNVRNNKLDILQKICSLNRCGDWSTWSTCPAAKRDQFGKVQRSRQCGIGPSFCTQDASKQITTETESKVCMGEECPSGFTKTNNGFCFMFHHQGVNRSTADEVCRDKKAFVINVNSKVKNDDLLDVLGKIVKSGTMWIDGIRKDVDSAWEYSYEASITGYSNWESGQPNKRNNNEFYKNAEIPNGKWWDIDDKSCYVVCEFV